MAGFTESSITLNFPDSNWFRFEHSFPYSSLSSFHYKEMDACWVKDMGNKNAVFYAIELKDYSKANLKENSDRRAKDIVKKVVDTIQMFMSARYQNRFGQDLEREKGVNLHDEMSQAYLITIIHVNDDQVPLLHALKDKCMSYLQAYKRVWDNIDIYIITHQQALRHFSEFVTA